MMQPVKSRAFSHIGYDAATGLLTIRYVQGVDHQYANVPSHVHAALMRATSMGKFVRDHIVGKYNAPAARR